VDNWFFCNLGRHLAARQPCAPIPAPAVATTGTKTSRRLFLWITQRLCQNYPQFYAPRASKAEIDVKNAFSAQWISIYSYLIDSNQGFLCNQTPCIPPRQAPACPVWPRPIGSPRGTPSLFLSPARRDTVAFVCARMPEALRSWGSGYSLIALYINSSSSRVSPFLWTSTFS
jgi:hypothetical protein